LRPEPFRDDRVDVMRQLPVPIPDSYWVIDGLLLAGEYPGARDRATARRRLESFVDAGIRTFVDLTEARELTRYDEILCDVATARGFDCRHLRYAVRDLGVPRLELLQQILDAIHAEVSAGRPTYVHCWGGIGRTGTVIGCWLVAGGLSGEQAIARIEVLRKAVPDAARPSPETDAQRDCILTWPHRL
jgi:hypothetical protein